MIEFWREVTHIEDRVGPQGGEYWLLTLTCGHLVAKRKRLFHRYRVLTQKLEFAPQKMICVSCRILND